MLCEACREGVEVSVNCAENDRDGNENEDGFLPSAPVAEVEEDLVVLGGDGRARRRRRRPLEGGTRGGGGRGRGRRRRLLGPIHRPTMVIL